MNTVKEDVKKVEVAKALPTLSKVQPTAVEQKTAISEMIGKFTEKTPPTAKERISRKALFDEVSKRYEHLENKSNDLKMFDAGNDKINAKIILKNQAGFEFEVSNSNVIKKVRDAMETELNILLAEAENEVLNFEI
jgi:hypothetical protein